MRTLNSISIIAVLALAGLSSCSKDTATDPLLVDNSQIPPTPTALAGTTALADTKIAATALPQTVPDYVATNYPDATVSKSEVENNGNYEVMLNQGTELVFEQAGAFLGVDDDTEDDFGDTVVDPTALPQPIIDYVAANHAGLTIASASLENNGHYELQLSDGSELVFDGQGAFLGIGVDENEGNDNGNGTENEDSNQNGNQNEDGTVIDAATLPQLVKDYLTTTYPDATITEARSMADGGFEVEMSTGIEAIFDANGSFVKTDDQDNDDGGQNEDGTVIDAATLPQLVKDYLTTTYPDATIVEARSMADGGFEVETSTGKEAIFDANGSFVKADDQDNDDGDGIQNEGNENDGDNQNGNQNEDGTVIDAATLPQLVKDYLSTTYPDATIVETRSMADGSFEVEMSTGIEAIFDANGSFVETEDGGNENGTNDDGNNGQNGNQD